MKVKIKKLTESAQIPTYANPGDAAADLYSDESFILFGDTQRVVNLGIAMEIPEGYFGLIRPRSGLSTKFGVGMNSSGVIDEGYRGPVKVCLINHSNEAYTVQQGDRIAQIVFLPVQQAEFIEQDLSDSVRGEQGLGSSGK